ncbi:hypothetical protein GCM10028857_14940 [Salinarchaeum chitinilyticum]
MSPELDCRETAADAVGDRIHETLDETDQGDAIDVLADRNVEATLIRYQIDRGAELDRDYETVGPDVWKLTVTHAGPVAEGEHPAFDARHLPPQQRHSTLTAAFDELDVGEGFRLVNDHDPKPLYHELNSTRGDVVGWDYRSKDGGEWIVEITKTGAAAAGDDDVVTRFDVREIPKRERHPTIHHRYGMLPEGGTMELIAPHVPRPLQREFRQRYGDDFEWSIVEEEPGRCTVQVTKPEAVPGDGETSGSGIDEASESGTDEPSAQGNGAGCGHHGDHEREHHDHGHEHDHAMDADGANAPADAGAESDRSLEITEELDVRDRPPAQRHQAIFEAYADLDGGEGFVLVNDHDPKPLYHQFDAEAGPEFRWEYRQQEPGEFRVLVGKAEGVETGEDVEATDGGTEAPF